MHTISKSILVSYSAEQMFNLVSDVPSYSDFLPWCDNSRIVETHEDGYTASIEFGTKGIRKAFTTRNVSCPYTEITMSLVSGPFSKLNGEWKFDELGPNGCKVSLRLEYEFLSKLLATAVGPAFGKISQSLVNSFHDEAKRKYGSGAKNSN